MNEQERDVDRGPGGRFRGDPHALVGAYAMDAVDDTEREQFERHLEACAPCRREVVRLREVGTGFSELSAAEPPPALRSAVLDGIAGVPQLDPDEDVRAEAPDGAEGETGSPGEGFAHEPGDELAARRARRHGRSPRTLVAWAAAGVAAVVLVVGGISWHPWSPEQSRANLTATEQVLQAQDAQRVVQKVDGATATVVRSPSLRKAVLVTSDLPAAPKGHVYELWYFDREGRPVRAGLMPRGTADATVLLSGDAGKARGVGITVEPAGGSKQPTTKPIVTFDLT